MNIYVWDIECTNLRADIGTLTVSVFGILGNEGKITKFFENDILEAKSEKKLLKWTREKIEEADILIGHNSIGFDKNFINGLLARYNMERLPKRIHFDTMLTARYGGKFLYQSNSMENLADVLGLPVHKDKPSKNDWRESNILTPPAVRRIRKRCHEDVKVTGLLWDKLSPYYMSWKGI